MRNVIFAGALPAISQVDDPFVRRVISKSVYTCVAGLRRVFDDWNDLRPRTMSVETRRKCALDGGQSRQASRPLLLGR